MPSSAPFRLNRGGLLLALISAAFAGEAGAAAARVDFAFGNVSVSGADGRERPVARGTELDNGDTVRTAEGRAQLRFTDGAYVSLQPNTEFAIKDYRYEGKTDGSENAFFALAKGAMRTVTGLVGRVNRNRYQISTPTATVGIRGTGGVIQVLDDGSTLVIGTSGIWSLTNPAGSIDVPAGVSGLAPAAPGSPPQQTSQAPQSGPAPLPPQPLFTQGEQRDTAGGTLGIPIPTPAPTFTPLVSGPGYTAALAYTAFGSATLDGGEGAAFSAPPTGDAVFNSTGQLTELNNFGANPFSFSGGNYRLEPGGSHGLRADGTVDFGSDGVLAWGRWVGPVTATAFDGLTETFGPNDGLHYVIGLPTPVLPTTGTATYSLLGATSPTYVGGLTAPGQVTAGALSVTWAAASYDIALQNFSVSMPANASTSTPAASFQLNGSTTISFTGAFWSMFMFGSGSVDTTGGSCSSSCSASVEGFFAGANAERAGMSYRINDFPRNIIGAAAFKKN
jgi:hypothetical protein